MSTQEWGIIIGIATTIVTSGVWMFMTLNKCLNDVAKVADVKRSRIYERVDEIKAINKREFVLQPVCNEKNKRLEDLVCRIEKKIDDFIMEFRHK